MVLGWNLITDEKTAVANYTLGDIPPTRRLRISGHHNADHCGWRIKHDGSLGRLAFADGKAEIQMVDAPKSECKWSFGLRILSLDDTIFTPTMNAFMCVQCHCFLVRAPNSD